MLRKVALVDLCSNLMFQFLLCVCVCMQVHHFAKAGIEEWSSNTLDKDDDCNGQDEACAFNALQLQKTGKKDDGEEALASVSRLIEWDEPVNISMSNSSDLRLGKGIFYCAQYCWKDPAHKWAVCIGDTRECMCTGNGHNFGSNSANSICWTKGEIGCHMTCWKKNYLTETCFGGSCFCHDDEWVDSGYKCS